MTSSGANSTGKDLELTRPKMVNGEIGFQPRLAVVLAGSAESHAQSPLVFHLKNIHSET